MSLDYKCPTTRTQASLISCTSESTARAGPATPREQTVTRARGRTRGRRDRTTIVETVCRTITSHLNSVCQREFSGFVAVAAPHHIRRLHSAKRLKHPPKIVGRDAAREFPPVDIHSVPLSLCTDNLCWEGVPNQEKGFERRVLRPGVLFAADDLASRLHQAILPGWQQH